MIRHIVLVRFAPAVPDLEKRAIFSALDRLRDVVPGMGVFAAGENISPEGLGKGFTHGFTIDFDTQGARDDYLAHPKHKEAGARLVAAADGGIDGILVLDLPLSGPASG